MTTATLPTIKIDDSAHRVYDNDKEVHLEPTGYRMLYLFLKYPGKCMSREDILDALWGPQASLELEVRLVDTNVGRIRKVIGKDAITTVVDFGYRFDGKVAA